MRILATDNPITAGTGCGFPGSFWMTAGLSMCPRLGRNLQRIKAEYRAEAILVWQKPVPVLHIGENRLFFHPSMAKGAATGLPQERSARSAD